MRKILVAIVILGFASSCQPKPFCATYGGISNEHSNKGESAKEEKEEKE